MIAASGGCTARGVERLLRGERRDDLEPGVAQDHPQRAEDLAPRRRRSGPAGARHRRRLARLLDAGKWIVKVAPWPGSDWARRLPPFASTKPRAIARPSPDPEPSSPARGRNGSKTRSSSSPRDTGAAVGDADRELLADPLGTDRDRRVARVAREFSITLASARSSWAASASIGGRSGSIATSNAAAGASTVSMRRRDQLLGRCRVRRAARSRPTGSARGRAGCRRARVSRSDSVAMTETSSARAASSRVGEPSPPAAAVIAVSGERRS